MPRREQLTEPQRLAFTEPATEEREMVRHRRLSQHLCVALSILKQ
jgi:hypothetical protein